MNSHITLKVILLNSSYDISSTQIFWDSITRELWTFGRVMLPFCSRFLCFKRCQDLSIFWNWYLFHLYVKSFSVSSLLLMCPEISVYCVILSLILTGLCSVLSLRFLWLWLMGFNTVHILSESQRPTFFVALTMVESL